MDQTAINPNIKLMGTTHRHMRILSFLDKLFIEKDLNNELLYGREQIALVRNKGKLIDVSTLNDSQQSVVNQHMNAMRIIYPDFMIFKDNPFIFNENKTRIAGVPDLTIEVWSPFNKEAEKVEKRNLFIAKNSEFWEIEQNSIQILCWRSDGTSYYQYLDEPVITPWQETLDLSPLARDARDVEPNDKYHGGDDEGIDIDL